MGMQLLFERSEEHGGAEGLGLLRGEVRRLEAPGLKLPHIGWSEVRWRRRSPLIEGLPDPAYLYHVHSFVAHPADPEVVVGTAEYGEVVPGGRGTGQRLRRAVAPREVLDSRPAAAGQLRRHLRRRGGADADAGLAS